MKIRNPRVAGVLGGAVTLALLAGCAGTPATTPSAAAPTTAATSAPAAQAVTIDHIHRLPDGEGMTKVAEIAEQWNKANPDIQVKTTKFDGKAAELVTKIEADVKAGTAACLAQAGYAEVPSLFTKGLVEDVTAEADKYKANYSEGAYTLMTVGGKAVGLPQDGGPLVYYYN